MPFREIPDLDIILPLWYRWLQKHLKKNKSMKVLYLVHLTKRNQNTSTKTMKCPRAPVWFEGTRISTITEMDTIEISTIEVWISSKPHTPLNSLESNNIHLLNLIIQAMDFDRMKWFCAQLHTLLYLYLTFKDNWYIQKIY